MDETKKRKSGWSTSGKLTANDPNSSFSLQAVFPEDASGSYTIQFAISGEDVSGIQAKAVITWTTEGNPVQREVTVSNGMSVTGVGQGCRVIVTDNSFVYADLLPADYGVTVTVAPGNRATNEVGPTLIPDGANGPTGGLFVVAPAGFVDVDIPQGVGVNSINVTASADPPIVYSQADILAKQLRPAAGLHATKALREYDPREYGFVPLVPGAVTLRLQNYSGSIFNFSVVLGIDG
jgi:hypothetical protein